eukprot:SAG11_NODE_136_length_15118_cov_14.188495_14_plen_80_part_00
MEDPVVISSGMTFDRMSLFRMIESMGIELPFQRRHIACFGFTCPVTRVKCTVPLVDGMPNFVKNFALRDAIEEWKFTNQ